MKRKQKIVMLAVVSAALFTATPAMAGDMYGKSGGAEAWSRGSNGQVAVKDNSADGDEAYSTYHRRTSSNHELRNKSGSGTTVYSGTDTSNYVRALKACQEIDFEPDNCSDWSYR